MAALANLRGLLLVFCLSLLRPSKDPVSRLGLTLSHKRGIILTLTTTSRSLQRLAGKGAIMRWARSIGKSIGKCRCARFCNMLYVYDRIPSASSL
ncbi:hypothetical protein B0J13DRAFT_185121 [Dactylonectria estremocensis]|uniref:Secreted protein n=1 Tax=Dactylonectria estremocensis TaxID=1079267 RepID=A0A9P9FB18_9HYPO|nr:hypothetical protein B0J13DRAFT_185121 [Dactylonectria estremocensis]